ncbi:MAG TPA: hypothetical protein VG734_01800 [Lacunisphaera sp.]|nr:hypothetical protein [Lacunisphaera sp.]
MTELNLVRDLFALPAQVDDGDFVLKLTEGLQHPEETARTYVATEALVDAFNQSLALVDSALRGGRSKATYLHGSFGSGKSHFMAMLNLLVSGSEAAWRNSALHPLRQKFGFVGKKQFCRLNLHMIGATSLEDKIFASYVALVQTRHPDAPIPALFADEKLFDDARRLLESMGDDKFFGEMGGAKKGWGKVTQAWTRERFDEVSTSTDPEQRELLFSALAKSWFRSSFGEARQYVDLDTGLATMARHASELGYDAILLFLDELILWLSHRASDSAWLHNEVQKMVKLVEAQESDRRLPIVSFIARQRDLSEMVGKIHTGAENARLHDSLNHWEGRYGTITLGDQNLPEIVEKRILTPKGSEEKAALERSFESLRASAGAAWNTLIAQQDATAFRKLYPFSPALVDALVALSNSLQRERTAIKLLMELLVEHIPDLKLGEVVRVGDLFDVLAGGEDPADGLMRSRFNSAKHLYRYQFLPMIQDTQGTNTAERCQRLRPGHPPRLGCSGCAEVQCRKDNRLIKTLLIAALVPEVRTLKDLTASRLAQLNHGTIKVLIPGTETAQVTQQLKKWISAGTLAQLHVGNESDPSVRVRLEGVDLKPILERYSRADNLGNRQRVIRDVLFEALGLDKTSESGRDEKVDWRGTKRHGHVLFANVRALPPALLRCAEDHDFRLVIDYPFDDEGKGPQDDLEVVERFVESERSWTLVWLPHFFSAAVNQLLGELVILEHILGDRSIQRDAVKDLSLEDQSRALSDLDNLRAQKKARLHEVLEQAYGLRQGSDADLDSSRRVDQHLHVLTPGAQVPIGIAPNLASAKETLIAGLLDARFPRHPVFTKPLSAQRAARLLEKFAELLAAENRFIPADRELHGEMLGTLGELGIVRVTETSVQLVEDRRLQPLENRRVQVGAEPPTVGQVRHWIDEGHKMGLQVEAQDLVVRCYALWSRRTFELHGKPYEAKSPLHGDATLEKPELPELTEWAQALGKASQALGVTFANRFLSPENLSRFRALLNQSVEKAAAHCAELPGLLSARNAGLGVGPETERLKTARSADEVCVAVRGKSGVEQVRALAEYEPQTGGAAVGQHVGHAKELAELLRDDILFGVFAQLRAQSGALPGAAELVELAASALRQDEVNVALGERLRDLARQAQRLLHPETRAPEQRVLLRKQSSARGKQAIQRELAELVSEVERALEEADDAVEFSASVQLTKRP